MTLFYSVVSLIILGSLYIFILRPWHLKWGAFGNELTIRYPGDEIVQKPEFDAVRGITVNAKPADIWKWIIQIGSGRAGWYSIDRIDNGGKPSAQTIIPEFQQIFVGQFIPFTPDQKNGLWVREYKENEYILWTDKEGLASWIWYLIPFDGGATRLITRLRTKYKWNSIWIIYYLIYDVGDIIMMAKCMTGIKKRAENNNQIKI